MRQKRTFWGTITSAVAQAGELLRLTLSVGEDEEIEQIEVQGGQYGFCSRPRSGAEALAIEHGPGRVVLGTADRRYTITLADGDVAMATSDGQYVKLLGAGGIEIKSTGTISFQNGALEVTA